jgi:hypothetical protein
MALVLIKEDGTGKADANSYASAADGDAYFEGHLYATAWTAATAGNKEKALVFATRLIDAEFQFNGGRVKSDQALQWPRLECRDPDEVGDGEGVVSSDVVPAAVVRATCEQARELLVLDRTASAPGEGMLSERTSEYTRDSVGASSSSSSSKMYSKADTRPIISHVARVMLSKYGAAVSGRAGPVRLVRV